MAISLQGCELIGVNIGAPDEGRGADHDHRAPISINNCTGFALAALSNSTGNASSLSQWARLSPKLALIDIAAVLGARSRRCRHETKIAKPH